MPNRDTYRPIAIDERPHRIAGWFLGLAIWLYGTPRRRSPAR
jgi:hypothetical protein